jgi:hypothetical protein
MQHLIMCALIALTQENCHAASTGPVAERVTLLENDRKSIDLHVGKVPDR